jgi:CO dehydrogenase maturation factor
MTVTIAVAGKGGTGKTTLTVLLIRHIVQNHWGSVLAIDADPSANLHLALGLPLQETIGDIREDTLQQVKTGSFPAGTSKQDYLDYKIYESLVEAEGIDLLAMGRPEGPGCYCAANNVLRLSIDRMANSYDYVVIDNEAGMEHLSRRTTRDVDLLIIVSDPTVRGISIAGRTKDLLAELQTRVRKLAFVVNMAPGGPDLPASLQAAVQATGMELAGVVPRDPLVSEFDEAGRPLVELPADAPVSRAVAALAERLSDVLHPSTRAVA